MSCLYQKRCKQSEIKVKYSTFSQNMRSTTQSLHNLPSFLYTASSVCTRRRSFKLMSMRCPRSFCWCGVPAPFRKRHWVFRLKGRARGWAGHGDFAPLAKIRERVGPSELAVSRRFAHFADLKASGLMPGGLKKGACDQLESAEKPSRRTAIGKLRVPTAFSSSKVYSYMHLY